MFRLQKMGIEADETYSLSVLDGVPTNIERALALANRKYNKTHKEFEKWAVLTLWNNQARINEKKGADGGIAGIVYLLIDNSSAGKAIFQVKSRPGVGKTLPS